MAVKHSLVVGKRRKVKKKKEKDSLKDTKNLILKYKRYVKIFEDW